MGIADLRKKKKEELEKLLGSIKKDLEKYTSDVIGGKEKNTAKIKSLKKDYARVQTLLKEKSLEGEQHE